MATSSTIVGVYETHEAAIAALEGLKLSGLPPENLSIMGKADIIETKLHAPPKEVNTNIPIEIGVVFGPILGILAGMSIVAIPGLGFIYGAGAIVGALAGFDIGLITGGISTLFLGMGANKEDSLSYQNHLLKGRYIITISGDDKIAEKAKNVLHTVGSYIDVQRHQE